MAQNASHSRTSENPLKKEGESKATTRALADKAIPHGGPHIGASETVTGQGGSVKRVERLMGSGGGGDRADTRHPSQHGGVRTDEPLADPRNRSQQKRSGTETRGPSPADLPRSRRTGTAARHGEGSGDRAGKDSRSGKTGGQRKRK
jgi:hypothetical protein